MERPARPGDVNVRPTSAEVSQQRFEDGLEQKSMQYSQQKKSSLLARYVYGIIFLIINLKAWFFRDYSQKVLMLLNYIKACGIDGQDCCQTLGVLRVSLGCFIFFFLMLATTINTRKLSEIRSTWHTGWWSLKIVLLIVSMVLPFFVPSTYVQLYGELARVGAGIFLVLQLVSVIEFISWWNNYWMPSHESKRSCSLGLTMSTVFYIASVCGIVVMYDLYGSSLQCSLNIFFISWTAVLLIVMMAISLYSKVNRGLLSSGIMASYLVFLCWSAIRSEPVNEVCNKQNQANGRSDWTTILGFLIAICAIVMATFSTGIDSKSFQLVPAILFSSVYLVVNICSQLAVQFRKDISEQEDDIPYDYGFFHLVFALGSMYFAMLFISWNLNNSAKKWSIDVGWSSTWVKIVNEWFAATIYLWKLISPVVRQPKVADHEGIIRQIDETTLA